MKVLRYLYRRPSAIAPTDVYYKCRIGWRDKPVVTFFAYVWNKRPQNEYEEHGLPSYDGTLQNLQMAWRSDPTPEQQALINAGTSEVRNRELLLPDAIHDPELNAKVEHYVFKRGNFPTKIINRALIQTMGIQGVALLQTCKQLLKEGTDILYGENKFVFDRGVHAHDTFEKCPHLVPGLPNSYGRPMSQAQINKALEVMFKKNGFQ